MPDINATPKKFAMQQVFEMLLRKPTDGTMIAYLTDVKTSGLENTVEMTYPTGSRGNVYVGTGFAHSRRATFNVDVATWNTDVMAAQNGTTVERDVQDVTYYDIMQAGTDGSLATKFTALGATGAEIGHVYKLDDDGTWNAVYEQSGSATTGKFAYATATKAITFDSAERPISGDYYACIYKFKPAGSQRITITSDAMPSLVLLTAYGLAKDICNGELYPAQIEGQAQIDGNWSFDVSADGDPAVQNLNMEFVKGCLKKDLYTFTIFTEEESTD